MAELVDAPDLGSGFERSGGSSPPSRTEKTRAAIKRSAIFPLTTLDGFDFDFPQSIDKDLVLRAAALDFIKERANVVFVGPSGVGKTHLVNAIAQMACLRGTRVRFTTAADLVDDLNSD